MEFILGIIVTVVVLMIYGSRHQRARHELYDAIDTALHWQVQIEMRPGSDDFKNVGADFDSMEYWESWSTPDGQYTQTRTWLLRSRMIEGLRRWEIKNKEILTQELTTEWTTRKRVQTPLEHFKRLYSERPSPSLEKNIKECEEDAWVLVEPRVDAKVEQAYDRCETFFRYRPGLKWAPPQH